MIIEIRRVLILGSLSSISEKAMAPHSSTLAWKIPWAEEPGRLQSMGVARSRTGLNDFTFTFQFHAMIEHFCFLGGNDTLHFVGGLAAVHGIAKSRTRLSDFTFAFHFYALEKEMATTPVFLPGESQGWGSLVGCRLWGHTESDTTEVT